MATQGMSYTELETRKRLLLEELANTQNQIVQNHTSAEAIDIHHPERSFGWKRQPYQEYPKVMYHPVKLDPVREELRLGTRRRNDANPTLAPLDIPHPRPFTRTVASKEEEAQALREGFVKLPPTLTQEGAPAATDGIDERLLQVQVPSGPVQTQAPAPQPSVARVLELNGMNRDNLIALAEENGVAVRPEMTKADLIEAIAYAPISA